MHITEKISKQMQSNFISTKCSYVQKINLKTHDRQNEIGIEISFIYEDIFLLTLLFKDVKQFYIERDSVGFNLGELLFYDEENGSPLCVGDELGGFSLVCNDIVYVGIEDLKDDWPKVLNSL